MVEKLKVIIRDFIYFILSFIHLVKDNIIDIMFVVGLSLIAIGLFLWHLIIGFIGTGLLLLFAAFLLFQGGE